MGVTKRELAEINAVCRSLREEAKRTDPIEQDACHEAVRSAYCYLGLEQPEVVFCDSPLQAIRWLQARGPVPIDEALVDGVWDRVAAAQAQLWLPLGAEQSVSFHNELEFSVLEPFAWDVIWWPEIAKRVAQKTYTVLCLAHAVEAVLEDVVTRKRDAWLLYTKASASLWKAVGQHASLRVLLALGKIDSLPQQYSVSRNVLEKCSWIYAFERACVVCQRPLSVEWHDGLLGTRQKTTVIRWRDGWESSYTPS